MSQQGLDEVNRHRELLMNKRMADDLANIIGFMMEAKLFTPEQLDEIVKVVCCDDSGAVRNFISIVFANNGRKL